MSDEANESYEPSESDESFEEEQVQIAPGRVVSASILTESDVVQHLTYKVEGLPRFKGPGYVVNQIEIAEIKEIIKDDDGNALCWVIVRDDESDLVGRSFLVPSEQLFSPDTVELFEYVMSELIRIREDSLTKDEQNNQLDRLIYAVGYEED